MVAVKAYGQKELSVNGCLRLFTADPTKKIGCSRSNTVARNYRRACMQLSITGGI